MSEDAIRKATKIIIELKLTPKNVDEYEDCEIISDLMDDEMMKYIEDEQLRRVLWEIRRLHVEIRRMNYAAYIDKAKELLGKIPDMKYIPRYHELERLSKNINEKDIKLIRDANVRDTLFKVVHIHDNIVDKKANVIKMIKLH